ncbi:unnamed protein product [Leuciscus chuanchicus]
MPLINTIETTEEITQPTHSGHQCTTTWSLSNCLFDPPLGAVGPVGFPTSGLRPVELPCLGLLGAHGPAGASSWFGAGVSLAGGAVCGEVGGLGRAVSPRVECSVGLGNSVGSAGIVRVAAQSPERQLCRMDAGACTVKRIGDLQALSVRATCMEFGPNDSRVILKPKHGYVPKSLNTPFRAQVISLSALPVSEEEGDAGFLCPVRALTL